MMQIALPYPAAGQLFGRSPRWHRVALTAQHRLPAVYRNEIFVRRGDLISYGINVFEPYRDAASDVDRILEGAKASDLPVQTPTGERQVMLAALEFMSVFRPMNRFVARISKPGEVSPPRNYALRCMPPRCAYWGS
jgi:hypothetical protein